MKIKALLCAAVVLPLLAYADNWSNAICSPSMSTCLEDGYVLGHGNNTLTNIEKTVSLGDVPCSGQTSQPCQPRHNRINSSWVDDSYRMRLKMQLGWRLQSQKTLTSARSQYAPLGVCQQGLCFLNLSPKKSTQNSPFMTQIGISMMQSAGHSLSLLRVFAGRRMDCTDTGSLIGSNKCCSGGEGALQSFWGQGCSLNARAIIAAKNHGRASFLGAWQSCSGALPWGGCLKSIRHYAFCLWPNQVTRIIQEQGRRQLGESLYADCRGFRLQPNQLAKIDFNTLDFSTVHVTTPVYP